MAIVKSKLLKQLSDNYPNFLKKDLEKSLNIVLNEIDESVKTPGLFLVGPHVRHDALIYCFIYKFRQRFANIATKIALQHELPIGPAEGSKDGVWGPFGNSECCDGCEC